VTVWCTPTDLLAAESDVDRLALLAGPSDGPPVSGPLLRLALAGEDLDDYLPAEQAAAAAAAGRMVQACTAAGELVGATLAARWPAGLDPVPGLVRSAGVGLALEHLLGARPAGSDTAYAGIVRLANTARATLRALADGTLQIGIGAEAAVNGPSAVRFQAADRLLTAESLAGMG
jgi:hypothetical protein